MASTDKKLSVVAFSCCGIFVAVLAAVVLSAGVALWTYVPPISAVEHLQQRSAVETYKDVKGTEREGVVCEQLALRADRSEEFSSWLVDTSRGFTNRISVAVVVLSIVGCTGFGYLGLKLRPRSAGVKIGA